MMRKYLRAKNPVARNPVAKTFVVLCAVAVLLAALPAQAGDYPSHPIRATIPFGAGSATDVVPRVVFDRLAVELGQPIVVENRVGAGGTGGTAMVVRAEPDGYSILGHSSALAIAPAIYPDIAFDPTRDLAAALMIGTNANVMVVPPSRPWRAGQAARSASRRCRPAAPAPGCSCR